MLASPPPSDVPPMGWNSWDCYGTSVTEAEVLANAEFMAERMLPHGWDTVVVDIQWYEPTARAGGYNDAAPVELDAYGRQLPAVNRFPSAADGKGFAPLADRIHALGLKFGVHIMRGIPRRAVERALPVLGTPYTAADVADRSSTCSWNSDNYGLDHAHPGAQAYYDAQVALFAEWGVDFVKADDMLGPYHAAEITAYARAIAASGRDIALSLSPGVDLSLSHVDHLRECARMWRVSNDLWDEWAHVEAQFRRLARWAPTQEPGHWADADMLPVGRIGIRAENGPDRLTRLTYDEQVTMLTLWCAGRSPLMAGCDLPTSPPETIGLLTNTGALDLLKHGRGNREVLREGELVVWTAHRDPGPDRYAAVFWTGPEPGVVRLPAGSLGVDPGWTGEEAWTGATAGFDGDGNLTAELPAHGARLYRFSPGE